MFRISLLIASILLTAHDADAATRRRAAAHPSNLTWTIEIMTQGGFSGHGVGSVIIHAGGSITATDLSSSACSARLTAGDSISLNQAIQHATPDQWNLCYVKASNPTGCCDQVQYRLTLKDLDSQHREKSFMTFWFDQSSDSLPADLSQVFKTAWEIRRRALDSCK